jgi:hypothetical protein
VGLSLEIREGEADLVLTGEADSYRIDPRKLWFTARRRGSAYGEKLPLQVSVGAVSRVPSRDYNAYQRFTSYRMNATLHGPPGKPGLYEVEIHASPGFARSGEGSEVDLATPYPGEGPWAIIWWPDTGGGDPELAQVRRRFVGHDVYAYGGSAIGCPTWFRRYGASTPLHVRAIARDRGRVEQLATGPTFFWGLDAAQIPFIAVEPLRLVVGLPAAHPNDVDTLDATDGIQEPCPAMLIADWQVDLLLDTRRPPPGADDLGVVRLGMSRDEVIWRNGYPSTLGDRSELRRQAVWGYDFGGPGVAYTVTFRHDHVTSFTHGEGMP